MNFINVVPFFPDDVPHMVSEARRVAKCTGIRKNAYSMSLHPENEDVMKKPKCFAEAFLRLQQKLRNDDIEVGILVQSLMGHGWFGQMITKHPWVFTINITGKTVYRHCMLDTNFRQYVSETIRMMAQCHPAFFLVDDDVRLLNNSANGPECFCPLHMKLFNEASPRKMSSDELREYLKQSKWDDPLIKIFEDIREKSLRDFAQLIRDSIDSVDDSISCGYCSGGAEYVMMGEIARILAGKNRSFLRIHNSNFSEGDPKDFITVAYHTAFCVKAAGKVDDLLDESDTCPHDRYSKSAISMHAHIVGGILNGLTGAKLWIANMKEKMPSEGREYEQILGAHRNFYDVLQQEVADLKWQGPLTILPDARYHYTPARFSSFYRWKDWQTFMLNRYGMPGRFDSYDPSAVVLLTGDMIEYLSDEKLKQILSGKALLDGYAALEIAKRGFASYLGVSPVQKEYRSTYETTRSTGRKMSFINDFSFPMLTDPDPKTEILSDLKLAEFRGSPVAETVAPGTVFYKNEHGGEIVTAAMGIATFFLNGPSPAQKLFLLEVLSKLDPETVPVYEVSDQPVYLRCGLRKDGSYLVAVVNLSFDEMEKIQLRCRRQVRKVELLNGSGEWGQIPFSWIGDTAEIGKTVKCYESVILKLS